MQNVWCKLGPTRRDRKTVKRRHVKQFSATEPCVGGLVNLGLGAEEGGRCCRVESIAAWDPRRPRWDLWCA